MPKEYRIERKRLYEQIWSKPMTKVAEEYSISGNGLKKICIKLNVPFPPVGYWQKLAAGHKINIPSLPDFKRDELDYYEYKTKKKTEYQLEGNYKSLVEKEMNPINKIKVPKNLSLPHPLIFSTKNILKSEEPDSDGLVKRVRSEILAISVSPKNLNRAFNIMNTLIKELEKRGFQIRIEMNYHERNESYAIMDGQKIQIELRETLRMNKSKTADSPLSWRKSGFERVFIPTGELRLEIKNIYGGDIKKIVKDQTNLGLEEQLNDFIINVYRSINYNNIKDREQEEEIRIEEEKEKARKQILKERRLEKEKTEQLFLMAKKWQRTEIVRSFLTELEKKLITENDLTDEKKDWIKWATEKTEMLDPLNNTKFLH